VGGQRHAEAALPTGKPGIHCIGVWAPGTVWSGEENLATTGFRSPDRAARSESLHGIRYPGPTHTVISILILTFILIIIIIIIIMIIIIIIIIIIISHL
jgi:hypothetical protein